MMFVWGLLLLLSGVHALSAPSIKELRQRVLSTEAGAAFEAEVALRAKGAGKPHRTATLRLFDTTDEPRVTLYRDSAAWCPYCQKLWMLLEEKKVPYRVELINMRSYGDKPASFTSKVRGGLLPALELDGELYMDSLNIMATIEQAFGPDKGHRAMLIQDEKEMERTQRLLREERQMFGAWCDYVFRGGRGGPLEKCMGRLDSALGEQEGPWLFPGDSGPGLVDLQYVSHVERILASVVYWKGENYRDGRWPNVERWFEALEARDSYTASRSDWYTHVNDIPPQYGNGVPTRSEKQKSFAASIDGTTLKLPLPPLSESKNVADLTQPGWARFEQDAPLEAAFELTRNFENVLKFAARGAGKQGGWANGRPDRARLADPYAKPATEDATLKDLESAFALVLDTLLTAPSEEQREAFVLLLDTSRRQKTADCLVYLRDRVGVPRDMTYPAARQLRATLNWLLEALV